MNQLLDAAAEGAELRVLPLSAIREPDQALRGPERHDPKYAELRDSIREYGVLMPIIVRREGDDFVLVDGMQRLTPRSSHPRMSRCRGSV